MKVLTIALDAMGGDFGPTVTVPAALSILKKYPQLRLILVGDETLLKNNLGSKAEAFGTRLLIVHASETVGMDEAPVQALRFKKDSSMRVAINLVHEKKAEAMVSAGNTGALMATAKFVLKMIEGIDRPAIVSALPSKKEPTFLLDLGANVDSSAENLFQFAVMGSELAIARGYEQPKVALLNIGSEEMKGNELVKKADALLRGAGKLINYVGYVEANSIFNGDVDVIVADGFVGNVALKVAEGAVKFLASELKKHFYRNWRTKLLGLLFSRLAFKPLMARYNPDQYNGASLLGLKGVVIKSHGNAKTEAFANAIEKAIIEIETDLTYKIHDRVKRFFEPKGTL